MKKILILTVVLVLSLLVLASCGGGKNTTNNTNNTNNTNVGWVSGAAYYRGDGILPPDTLQLRFMQNTNVVFQINGGKDTDRLFVVGKCDEAISGKAYSVMERAFSGEDNKTIYTIYTDGKSIAIAYDSMVALYAALDYFFEEIEKLDLSKEGPIVIQELNPKTYVEQAHDKARAEALAEINTADGLSEEAVEQLRLLYTFYDEDVYMWLANLWDPDMGGFYYSNSARNTDGFLPDLESTAQALLFLTNSGMLSDFGNKYQKALPAEIASAILQFVLDRQSSEDGYFYHDQWGQSINATRRGRDLSWATRIISAFGETPYWNTPNGVAGQYGAPGSGVSAAAYAGSIRTGSVVAASQVVVAAKPSYLSSVEKFKQYLNDPQYFDWENNSYAAGNRLESELGQIQASGKAYTDALIEFLNSKQKSNGLWENKVTYDSVNGLMKISVLYTSIGVAIPNVEKSLESACIMLESTDTPSHVCSIYNPWEAVANLLISIEKVSGKSRTNELKQTFRDKAEDLIKITYDKLSEFQKADGGFSYYKKYSAANSQGAPVAVTNTAESDVNATMICVNSIITAMFDVFGIDEVARYYPVDYAYFYDTIISLNGILKDEIPPAEATTFDDYDPTYGETVSGVVTYPADMVYNVVGDTDGLESGTYKWFQSSVIANPFSKDPDDLVLYSQSFVYPDASKTLADAPSSTKFEIPNAYVSSLGDCYVYDADMYFVSGYGKTNNTGATTKDPIMQLFFMTESQTCASVNFIVYTENGVDYVKIGENFAGLDGKDANVAGGIPMDQWVNIRIEVYKLYETGADGNSTIYTPKVKVYVNGEYQGECDAIQTGSDGSGSVVYYDRKISQVSISYYRFLASEMYFNNVLVERCDKEYVKETNPDAIVDTPLPDEEMRESYGFEDGLLNTSNVANKVRVLHFGTAKYINAVEGQTHNPYISYSITADPTNNANRVLKVVATKSNEFDKPSRTEVNLYNAAGDGTDYTFSGKFYYPASEIGAAGAVTQIVIFNSLENIAYSLNINAVKSSGTTTLSIVEANNRTNGATDSTSKTLFEGIVCDEWFTLKVVFHKVADTSGIGADVYVNDQKVTDMTYQDAATAQFPITKTLITHQRTNTSTLYLDDLSFAKSGNKVEYTESTEREASFSTGFDTKYLHNFSFDGAEELSVADIDPNRMENLYTKFYLYADPTDAANQVLRAVNKKGGTNAGYTRLDFSNENPTGNCYTFETRMYMEVCEANYVFACLRFIDTNGTAALNLNLSLDKDTGSFKVATTSSGVSPAAGTNLLSGMTEKIGKATWFDLKIEFYHEGANAGKENTFLKIYVNDTLVYSGVTYHKFGADIAYLKLEHSKTDKSSAILYDDVSFTRTNKTYTEK